MITTAPAPPKPKGWLIGLAVGLITLGVILGLLGIGLVAQRKQRYRLATTNETVVLPPPR